MRGGHVLTLVHTGSFSFGSSKGTGLSLSSYLVKRGHRLGRVWRGVGDRKELTSGAFRAHRQIDGYNHPYLQLLLPPPAGKTRRPGPHELLGEIVSTSGQ